MNDRLQEALEFYEKAEPVSPDGPFEVVAEAARRFLALTETGPEKRWCVEHEAPGGPQDGGPFDEQCYEWWLCEVLGDECEGITPCSMIPVFVIPADYLTEEETR